MYKMKTNYSELNTDSSTEFGKREFKTHHSSVPVTTICILYSEQATCSGLT